MTFPDGKRTVLTHPRLPCLITPFNGARASEGCLATKVGKSIRATDPDRSLCLRHATLTTESPVAFRLPSCRGNYGVRCSGSLSTSLYGYDSE